MKLIIGLGNPGTKYHNTRHNIGFLFLDWLIDHLALTGDWKKESKFQSEIFTTEIGGEKVLLIKPQTFMNLSGSAVLKFMSFYKISTKDILIVYDDISMDFGKVRYRVKGSSGGQNGVKDIIGKIGDEFPRIKIGIGHDARYKVSDWVLSQFSPDEREQLEQDIFIETFSHIENNFY